MSVRNASGTRSGTRLGAANRGRIARPVPSRPVPCSCGAIHACNPTRRRSLPVENATAADANDRHGWMALRAIGGGR